MTVQAQNSVQYYKGPIEIGTELSIVEFTFIDNSHVSAKVRGNTEVWKYGYDYTVSGAQTLIRTITVQRRVAENEVLAVYLDVPITQNISPEEGGNFPASTNEYVLDKLTHISQMLDERVKRSLQISIDTPFSGTLPAPEPNKALKISPDGNSFVMSDYDPDTALVQTEQYRTQAQQSAAAAKTSQNAAKTSENNAKTSATTATQKADHVESIYEEAVPTLTNIINNGVMSLSTASTAITAAQIGQYISKIPKRCQMELKQNILYFNPGHVWIFPMGTADLTSSYPKGSTFKCPQLTVVDTCYTNNKFFVFAKHSGTRTWDYKSATLVAGLGCLANSSASIYSVAIHGISDSTETPSTVGTSTTAWYNPTTNYMHYSRSTEQPSASPASLPVWAAATKDIGIISYETNDSIGHVGNYVYMNKDFEYKLGNGTNADGTRIQKACKSPGIQFAGRATSANCGYVVRNSVAPHLLTSTNYSHIVDSQVANNLGLVWSDLKNTIMNPSWLSTHETINDPSMPVGLWETDSTGKITRTIAVGPLNVKDSGSIESLTVHGAAATGFYVQDNFLDDSNASQTHAVNHEARWYQKDKRNVILGGCWSNQAADGRHITGLFARRNINGTDVSVSTQLIVDADGIKRFAFPMCTTMPTTSTTAAINLIAPVIQNYRNGKNFYYKRSDGFIHQGGTFTVPAIAANKTWNTTLTMLISFATTDFHIKIYPMQDNGNSFHLRNNYAYPASKNSFGCLFSTTATTSQDALWYWEACGY